MSDHSKSGVIQFLFDNSLFLIGGALLALVWANVDKASYDSLVHLNVLQTEHRQTEHDESATESQDAAEEAAHDQHAEGGQHGLTIHFIVNDILMALFFAIAGKEVWESMLPGGALSNPRKAATPLLATLGGIIGPAGLYILGALLLGQTGWFGQAGDLGRGWAVPCATDIAFSYLVARLIFGNGHPAIAFLLLLAIADDAAGLVILAVAYPQNPLEPMWFLLTLAAMATALSFRKLRLQSFWWYLLIPGVMSWFSFYYAGIHAALGLVPIIPCLPHAHTDLGIFAREELNRSDTLNEFEHWWKTPRRDHSGVVRILQRGSGLWQCRLSHGPCACGADRRQATRDHAFHLDCRKGFPSGNTGRHVIPSHRDAGYRGGNRVHRGTVCVGSRLSCGQVSRRIA